VPGENVGTLPDLETAAALERIKGAEQASRQAAAGGNEGGAAVDRNKSIRRSQHRHE
jgi:hypothetical protein